MNNEHTSTLFDVGDRMLSQLTKSPKGTVGNLIILSQFNNICSLPHAADNAQLNQQFLALFSKILPQKYI